MRDLVSVNNITKNYGDFCAVDSLSFSVGEGEIFGFLGPNGAGKSTTLSIITTLIDFDKGKVAIDGFDINKDRLEAKKLMGMVPQEIALYKHLTALDNVKFFASLYGLKGDKLDKAAKEALEFVGLSDRMKMKPKKMSGGMQRRLNIACGIAHNPKLIVMDEPTVGVDAQSREHILNSIRILRDRGATVIYTSHYMQEVEEICDRIAIIDRGKLVAIGTKDELVSNVTDIHSFIITTKFPVEFDKKEFEKKIAYLPGVKNIYLDEWVIKVDIQVGHNSVNKILEVVIEGNLPIYNVVSEVPNLETTFLTLTGHELR
ncbi:MAG: ATP-binding cassette protein [Clostridiales bacterium]|jgi:ABC-2 type transport system ATP-binding protein|nr:ATP-binding cassette protein [Clostridiales bacterium]